MLPKVHPTLMPEGDRHSVSRTQQSSHDFVAHGLFSFEAIQSCRLTQLPTQLTSYPSRVGDLRRVIHKQPHVCCKDIIG